jgi:hypothetical protein
LVGVTFAVALVFPAVFEEYREELDEGFFWLSSTTARIPPTTNINAKAPSTYLELLLARTGCACGR